jgi:hypothetical protein
MGAQNLFSCYWWFVDLCVLLVGFSGVVGSHKSIDFVGGKYNKF